MKKKYGAGLMEERTEQCEYIFSIHFSFKYQMVIDYNDSIVIYKIL